MMPSRFAPARRRALAQTLSRLEDRLTPTFAGHSAFPAAPPAMVVPAAALPIHAAGPMNSAHAAAAEPRGLGYFADGDWIDLARRPNEWAVRATDPLGLADALAARNPATAGVELVRQLGDGVAVLAAPPGRAAEDLSAALSADWVAPVYTTRQNPDGWLVPAGEVIIALPSAAAANAFFTADARFSGYRPLWGTPDQFVATLADANGDAALTIAADLAADDRVEWASPNFYQSWQRHFTPNDPIYPEQWHLHNTGQNGGKVDADVDAPEAWDVTPGGSSSVLIAVVDDGMEYTHPDLAPNMMKNAGEIAGNGKDDDGNGYVDDVFGYDFTTLDGDPGPSDPGDAHATAVAGIAAAKGNNSEGVAGIAYNAKITAIRIFTGGTPTSEANIASAVYYAAGRTKSGSGQWRDVHVMNNSWGGGSPNTAMTDAFTWASNTARGGKGTATFVSSGNGFASSVSYPASLAGNLPGVIAVGASSDADVRSDYSNFGPQLDFVAPSSGGNFGTVTTDRVGTNGYDAGDYTVDLFSAFGGTSSASPLAAGVGALAFSLNSSLTAAQVRGLMRNTTDLIGANPYDAKGFAVEYGYGRVNAFTAVQGVGVAEIQVLDGAADVADGTGSVNRSALVGATTDVTIRVRNQGTLDLTLGSISLAPGPFTLLTPFGDSTLSVGESTAMVVRFAPTTAGTTAQTVSFATNDASEPLFDFQLKGTAIAKSVSGAVFEDLDGNGTRGASEPALAGQTVYLDTNGNGKFDGSTTVYNSPNVPVSIFDNTTSVSTVTISGATGTIADVNLKLNITHTFTGDLKASLTAPNGAVVELFNYVGGGGANFTDTVLDDEAAVSITAGFAPFAGSFKPQGSLAVFDGLSANGTWTLTIRDDAGADTGTLNSWSLTILSASESFAVTNAAGGYEFLNLASGTYPVRVAAPGWNAVAPASGAHTVTITTPNDQFPGRDFALAKADAIYGKMFNDLDGDGAMDAGEPGVSNFRAYADLNGNGTYDTPPASTFNSSDVGQTIDGSATVFSTLNVSGFTGNVVDVNVKLTITHTWVEDLDVYLISPTGTKVELFTEVGGGGDNFTDTVLDDEAAVSITAGFAPFTGSFRPEGSLAAFDGATGNGTWKLQIDDTFPAFDNGKLLAWSVTLTGAGTTEPSVLSGTDGIYRLDGLTPGTIPLRRVLPTGWVGTFPASGVHTVSLAAGQTVFGRDFGQLSTPIVVDLIADENDGNTAKGDLSLREAIGLANADPSLSIITFDPAVFGTAKTITLTLGEIAISGATTILGPGKDLLTLSGNNAGRIFNTSSAKTATAVTISQITLTGGNATGTGGAVIGGDEALTLSNVRLTGNKASSWGGAVFMDFGPGSITIEDTEFTLNTGSDGGAVDHDGTGPLVIRRTWFDQNKSTGAGGGLFVLGGGSVLIEESAFSKNTASLSGGGFFLPGGVMIRNTTVSGNSAPNGGGLYVFGTAASSLQFVTVTQNTATTKGGGLVTNGPLELLGTIVSGNTNATAPDISGSAAVVAKGSAIGSATGFTLDGASTGNLPFGTDLKLGSLINNGGPTPTHSLLTGSPALDKATPIAGITTDQRGFARPFGAGPDIGAFEAQSVSVVPVATLTTAPAVTKAGDTTYKFTVTYFDETGIDVTSIGLTDVQVTGKGFAVPQAPTAFNVTGSGKSVAVEYTIPAPGGSFDAADVGSYTVTMNANEVFDTDATKHPVPAGALGTFAVSLPTTFVVDLAVDENDGNTSKGDLSLREAVALANADPTTADTITFDPAVFGTKQTVTLTLGEIVVSGATTITGPGKDLLTLSGNNASRIFKVFNAAAKLDVAVSKLTFTQGKSDLVTFHGGAIFADGENLTVSDSAFSGNFAFASGGGVGVLGGALVITDSTFTGNTAEGAGGAFAAFLPGSSLTVRRTVASGNSAINAGGALYTSSPTLIEDSTLSGNSATDTGTFGVAGAASFSNFYGPTDVTIRNSTISGNTAAKGGGGIDLFQFAGTLTLEHVTIAENTAKGGTGGGGIGAISETGTVVLRNTIVAGNTDLTGQGGDIAVAKGTVQTKSSFLSTKATAATVTDLGGTLIQPFANLQLAPLADNGGPTPTRKLGPTSAAANAGSVLTGVTADQRGKTRPADGLPDIGAFEAQPLKVTSVVVNDGADQRSRVTAIVVTFDQPVTTPVQPGDSFELRRQSDNALIGLTGTVVGGNSVRLTFNAGATVDFGSLADGRYTLTAIAGKLSGERPLDGNGDGISGDNFVLVGDKTNKLFRLFGDGNGDGSVNFNDFLQFRGTFGLKSGAGGYLSAFDFDAGGAVDFNDFLQFRSRFGTSI